MRNPFSWSRAWRALVLGTSLVVAASGAAEAQQPTGSASEQAYQEWLMAHQPRQVAAAGAMPTTLDLANPSWRRDWALWLDSWGALIQEARDQRPPTSQQALHSLLLDALDRLDHARRALLVAIATGQDPGPEMAAQLRLGRQALEALGERARASGDGRPSTSGPTTLRHGNLRVQVVGVTRPYVDRGQPLDQGWEYLVVRLRLENTGGEPVGYDAFHFRLRTAEDTLHNPVPLGMPDELLYGALEGNRLAATIVGNIAFPIRHGVPATAVLYENPLQEGTLHIPLDQAATSSAPAREPTP